MNYGELLKDIETHLIIYPEITSASLASTLNVKVADIEKAVQKAEGATFREYSESRRLVRAFDSIRETRGSTHHKGHQKQRTNPRLTIPGALVRYSTGGRRRLSKCQKRYPILDINRGGMAFLADEAEKPGQKISLGLCFPLGEEDLMLEARVIYALPVQSIGYRYRIGVGFQPFLQKKGCNPPEAEIILSQIEKRFVGPRGRFSRF